MLRQRWRHVTFLHWRYPAAAVQALLPDGLVVDTSDGAAWVGITPFLVEASRPAPLPAWRWLATFPETNVRTYVTGPDGRDGLSFLSIEAAAPITTAGARSVLRLPYHWSDMSIRCRNDTIEYRSSRRTDPRIGHHITVRPVTGALAGDDRRLAEWLSGRWRAWINPWGRLATVAVDHEPWILQPATVVEYQSTLLEASGLNTPDEPPLCFVSAGVHATLGWPRLQR